MLPVLAGLFGVKVDDLLGINQAENERHVQEIITAYDASQKPLSETFLPSLKAAVADYPLDYRLWVRYMECLLKNTRGLEQALAVEKQVREIYENIMNHCKDDSVRMWAKRVFIMHLHSLAQPLEPGGPLGNPARQEEAEQILAEMPGLRASREHIAVMVSTQTERHQQLIDELLWLLLHALYHHPKAESFFAFLGDDWRKIRRKKINCSDETLQQAAKILFAEHLT
jgi:hypothetical protein